MRLELFDVRRRWPWQRTQRDDERGFVNSRILFFCLLFNSSALYYLQTPTWRYGHASTPPQFLPIAGDRDVSLPLSLEWPVWLSSSGNNYHAVHRSLSPGASLFFTAQWEFLPCLIWWAKLYFTKLQYLKLLLLLVLNCNTWSYYYY